MPKIITVVSPKSGCGASVSAAYLWQCIARESHSILAVDMCAQHSTLDLTIGSEGSAPYNINDVAIGLCTLDDALYRPEECPNAAFLSGAYGGDYVGFHKIAEMAADTDFEYLIADVCYDDYITDFALAEGSSIVIYVTDCTYASVRMCAVAAQSADFEKSYILINKIIPEYIENGFCPDVDNIVDSVGLRPIGLIPWDPDAVRVSCMGILNTDTSGDAADAFANTALRIKGQAVPAIDFDRYYDCFKIKKRRFNK